MSQSINTAARRHDRAVANLWACLAIGIPLMLVERCAIDQALDRESLWCVALVATLMWMTVGIVMDAVVQVIVAGRAHRSALDASGPRAF